MVGLILQRLGYPSGKQRDFIDAVQSARGGGEDLEEPHAPFRRSHETIAQYMQCKGENEKARSQSVGRCLDRHDRWQQENKIVLIDIIRSTRKNEVTGYRDFLTPIADQAMQHALSDPDWRKGREGIEKAQAKAVDWAVRQFPTFEPDGEDGAEGDESSKMGLEEYITFQIRRLQESAAKAVETIEGPKYAASTDAIRFARLLAREWARVADSMARTQAARRMPITEPRGRRGEGSGSIYYGNEFDEIELEGVENEVDFAADSDISSTQTVDEIDVTPSTTTTAPQQSADSGPADEDLPQLSEIGEAAVRYARLGYYVVPNHHLIEENGKLVCSCRKGCGSPGKHPRWHGDLLPDGINSASNDPAIVRQWWTIWQDANIGFECSERAGVFAHDFDGEAGIALFEKMRATGDIPGDAVIQRTGGGGYHVLSRWEAIEGLSNWVKPKGAPFDVRGAKKAAQVIVSPSRHVSGGAYEWLTEYESLPPMPAGLRTLLVESCEQMRVSRSAAVGAGASSRRSSLTTGDVVRVYNEGARNDELFRYGAWWRGVMGADELTILEKVRVRNQESCIPPLPDDEVRKIAASCARYERGVVCVGGGR